MAWLERRRKKLEIGVTAKKTIVFPKKQDKGLCRITRKFLYKDLK